MNRTDYAFRTELELPYREAVKQVKEGLQIEGFGVLTEVDVEKVMEEKLRVRFRPYTIIGACNPPLSNRAFNTNLEAGLVLPCNVIIYEQNGKSVVEIADPKKAMGILADPRLDDVIAAARTRLERVVERLERVPINSS
ncbi:MAG TPA: DUF302 domain-containing protein [Candidatus Acetothermia bacterium]|nr:DUF302 domain-containing protein [Candidatus Acetothermia bacterium]